MGFVRDSAYQYHKKLIYLQIILINYIVGINIPRNGSKHYIRFYYIKWINKNWNMIRSEWITRLTSPILASDYIIRTRVTTGSSFKTSMWINSSVTVKKWIYFPIMVDLLKAMRINIALLMIEMTNLWQMLI